jgi:hypothetical protein
MWPAGRTLDEDPDAITIFEMLVENRGLNITEIIIPPHIGNVQAFASYLPLVPFTGAALVLLSSCDSEHVSTLPTPCLLLVGRCL